jgi:hypothetical protein
MPCLVLLLCFYKLLVIWAWHIFFWGYSMYNKDVNVYDFDCFEKDIACFLRQKKEAPRPSYFQMRKRDRYCDLFVIMSNTSYFSCTIASYLVMNQKVYNNLVEQGKKIIDKVMQNAVENFDAEEISLLKKNIYQPLDSLFGVVFAEIMETMTLLLLGKRFSKHGKIAYVDYKVKARFCEIQFVTCRGAIFSSKLDLRVEKKKCKTFSDLIRRVKESAAPIDELSWVYNDKKEEYNV